MVLSQEEWAQGLDVGLGDSMTTPQPNDWAAFIARFSFSLTQTLANKCCNKASHLFISLV